VICHDGSIVVAKWVDNPRVARIILNLNSVDYEYA